jgi:hypothetical protein
VLLGGGGHGHGNALGADRRQIQHFVFEASQETVTEISFRELMEMPTRCLGGIVKTCPTTRSKAAHLSRLGTAKPGWINVEPLFGPTPVPTKLATRS